MFFVDRAGPELADDAAAVQDQDAVADRDDHLDLGADDYHADAAARQFRDDRLDLCLGAHVDAPGGIIQQDDLRLGGEPARDQDFLLVAAGQLADLLVRSVRPDGQPPHEVADLLVDPAAVHDAEP